MSGLEDLASGAVDLMAAAGTAAATGMGSTAATAVADIVRSRLRGAGQDAAVAQFDAAPQEPGSQTALRGALVAILTADQALVVQLTDALSAAATDTVPPPPVYVASGGGVTVQGSGNRLRGNFAGRDQIIHNIRHGDARTLVVLAVVAIVLAFAVYGGVQAVGGLDTGGTNGQPRAGGTPNGATGRQGGTGTQPPASPSAPKNTVLWTVPKQPWPFSSPVVSGGRVYYLAFDERAGVELVVVDASTGAAVPDFTAKLDAKSLPGPLTVADGRFYLVDDNGVLYAGDDKRILWRYSTGATILTPPKPTVADGTVYFGGSGVSHELHAVDATAGTERWTFTAKSRISTAPAVSGGVVYTGSDDGDLYALDAATGKPLWTFPGGEGFFHGAPVIAGDTVYIAGDKGTMFALDKTRGTKVWTFHAEGDAEGLSRYPLIFGNTVYFGSDNKVFYALAADTGTKRWSVTTGGSLARSPVLADGIVYFGMWFGKLYAFDAVTGKEVWTHTTEGELPQDPAIGEGTVIIATQNENKTEGHLYALHR
ncbi:PQQ-binding-like beta-propeller repeat protein [Streptomyces sp. NPDC004667]|uniref:outer membrane protein assembly factor BamB family protein n=1 Tax=Streptomyces sp. NPDC004667 TaxID=3154285 RepID=UPI0033A8B6C2